MDAFDYPLPSTCIAQQPVEPRSSARLMVSLERHEPAIDSTVAALTGYLRSGDLLVVNETKVMSARLDLTKETGGNVEVLLLDPLDPTASGARWECLIRPGRRVKPGTDLYHRERLVAQVGGYLPGDDGRREITLAHPDVPDQVGSLPLPPYLHGPLTDPQRYQTVYASAPGSAAAPTAGLHLTHELLDEIRGRGVQVAAVDLTVGLATFRPVTADRPEDHVIHTERFEVSEATMEACRRAGRVVAVGTTTVRALETAAMGSLTGRTSLFIHGEFEFKVVDLLITNFHLPRSSLLLMIDAFYGPRWRDLYSRALQSGYRFLSLGDAMLLGKGVGR